MGITWVMRHPLSRVNTGPKSLFSTTPYFRFGNTALIGRYVVFCRERIKVPLLFPSLFGTDVETIEKDVGGRRICVQWDWGNFKSTEGFPVDDNLINWAIGQGQALK